MLRLHFRYLLRTTYMVTITYYLVFILRLTLHKKHSPYTARLTADWTNTAPGWRSRRRQAAKKKICASLICLLLCNRVPAKFSQNNQKSWFCATAPWSSLSELWNVSLDFCLLNFCSCLLAYKKLTNKQTAWRLVKSILSFIFSTEGRCEFQIGYYVITCKCFSLSEELFFFFRQLLVLHVIILIKWWDLRSQHKLELPFACCTVL